MMSNTEMPAAVIRTHAASPEYLFWPLPRRTRGQALVRVMAAPISPLDLLCASGKSYFGAPQLPYIPGVQGVGIVMEADAFVPGQRVWFSCDAGMKPGDGSMALYCVIDESSALVLPDQVDDDLAAALGLSAIAASRDEEGRARALSRGADAVVDLTGDDVEGMRRRMAAACEGPLHLVIDPVWGLPAEAAVRVLAAEGRLINIGSAAGPTARFESAILRSRLHAILGYTNNALTHEQKAGALTEILTHAAAGRCTVEREMVPLARAAEAWERQAACARRKLILVP